MSVIRRPLWLTPVSSCPLWLTPVSGRLLWPPAVTCTNGPGVAWAVCEPFSDDDGGNVLLSYCWLVAGLYGWVWVAGLLGMGWRSG